MHDDVDAAQRRAHGRRVADVRDPQAHTGRRVGAWRPVRRRMQRVERDDVVAGRGQPGTDLTCR